MKRWLLLVLLGVLFVSSACTKGQTAVFFAEKELGSNVLNPKPYMYEDDLRYPGFWCDEFATAMLRKAGITVNNKQGSPVALAAQFPKVEGPYLPGDLVFVYRSNEPYSHMGILQKAEGDHLWVIEGNWLSDGVPSVVLNERWIGDGNVSEVHRP